MGLQPRASASCRMLTPSRPAVANLCWATAQSRARKASTSAAERFLGMPSGVRRQHARAEADGVEYRRVLGDQPLHESAKVLELGRVLRGAGGGHPIGIEAHALPVRHGRATEEHEQVLAAEDQMLGERVHARDEAVLHERRRLDPVLHMMLGHRHRVGIHCGQSVECAEMLEVDPVRHGDPGIDRARPAEARLMADLVLRRPWDAGHGKERLLAVEGPDEAPSLSARIGGDARAGGNLVAGGDVHAAPRAVEAPVVIGAADLSVDHLAHGEIGAQVWAEGALHQGAAVDVAIEDHTGAQEVSAHHLTGNDLAGHGKGEPGLVEALRRLFLRLDQGLGCAHGAPPWRREIARSCGYKWTLYIYTVNASSSFFPTSPHAL